MWNLVGDEFIGMILEFFENGRFPRAMNTTWITLIPKIEGAAELKEFRAIGMVGCIYKIIPKILTLRIMRVMPSLVGKHKLPL